MIERLAARYVQVAAKPMAAGDAAVAWLLVWLAPRLPFGRG